jgi:hypothetical protein
MSYSDGLPTSWAIGSGCRIDLSYYKSSQFYFNFCMIVGTIWNIDYADPLSFFFFFLVVLHFEMWQWWWVFWDFLHVAGRDSFVIEFYRWWMLLTGCEVRRLLKWKFFLWMLIPNSFVQNVYELTGLNSQTASLKFFWNIFVMHCFGFGLLK